MRRLKRTTFRRILTLVSFFIIVFFILYTVLKRTEERTRTNTINTLQTVLHSSQTSIKDIWVENHFIDAKLWASNPNLLRLTKELLKIPREPHFLLECKEMEHVREFFKERLFNHGALGIFIISPDFVSLASINDQNVGIPNFLANQHKDRLEKVFNGHNQIIPPLPSDIPLLDNNGNLVDGYPTMFILVPIKDTDGSVIAALSIRLNPFGDFNLLASATQIGFSGETYLVSKDGKLLTESRFLDHLYRIGSLTNETYSMLNIEIRDPGINLLEDEKHNLSQTELPFTYAMQQLLKDKSGSSKIAYRDYRGVDVLGSWLWDDELDIGFITEIDEDEALMSYKNTRLLTISLLLTTVFLMLLFSYVYWKAQKVSVEIIEQKEHYFRTLLNNAINGIIIINERGIIETFNLKAEDIFGYRADEVIGKNVSMLANEYDRKRHDTYIHNFIEKRRPKVIGKNREVTGIRKDGSSFPLKLGVNEINLRDRTIFMGMTTDLTQEKEAEKKLFEIEEKFKRTFNQAPISMVISNLGSKFQKVNHAFCNLLGYSEKELIKMSFSDITFPNHVEESKSKMKLLLEGAITKFSLEKQYIKKNKEMIWGNVTVSTLKNKSGKITNSLAIIENITLRKNAEDTIKKRSLELEKSKRVALSLMQDAHFQKERVQKVLGELEVSNQELKKLNLAIEQSEATIVITDKNGKIEYVNPAFTKISGYTFKEAIGHPPGILKSGRHSKEFYKDMWDTILAGKTWKGDIINKKKSGEEYWESTSISPMFDKDGEITNFVGVKGDISKRKLLEEELIKSKVEADKANSAKSDFLANMSHEIRTPMNSILGFSEILSKYIKDTIQIEYLSSIQSSGKTLLELINNILDLSKIESGKFDFSYEPSNIKGLIQEIIGMFRVKCNEMNLQLNVNISKELPDVLYMDELRVKQILINLINNSIKFTEKGSIEIEVITQNITDNFLDLILKVKDTGIGIPKKYHKKIFQAFNQIDMLDNKKYEGSGLGLTITQQLVKQMNGKITLESKKGQGSIFTITLKKVKISREDKLTVQKIEFDPDSIQFEKSTVLIVDDIKSNRNVLKGYMIDYKINCIEAENGIETITAIEKNKPDLVFLDLRMPIMDGYEANEIIKGNPNWSSIPIVAITASAFDKDEKKVLAKGFSEYVSKPASLNEILKILMKYLKHSIVATDKELITEVVYEPIDKLNEILLEIDNKVIPVWEEIKNIRKRKKVLLLVKLLLEIGKKYNVKPLISYGNEMLLAIQSFNIGKEKSLIQQLPDFVEKLKCLNNGK
jgi:PAS domain S-box-containing protein